MKYVHDWITGVQLTWDVFDGLRTRGKVMEAAAQYQKPVIELNVLTYSTKSMRPHTITTLRVGNRIALPAPAARRAAQPQTAAEPSQI